MRRPRRDPVARVLKDIRREANRDIQHGRNDDDEANQRWYMADDALKAWRRGARRRSP